jgi:hypothetical protein
LGLRRREIDLLEWQSFDFVTGTMRILPTRWYALKTHESAAELPIEPEILELFRGWRARATGEFVLESDRPPRPPRSITNIIDASRPLKPCSAGFEKKALRGINPFTLCESFTARRLPISTG